ncbi:hypothetical protein [Aquimarina aquimarini]|nr:hypothetical protein [Aquimarina aquimarini]
MTISFFLSESNLYFKLYNLRRILILYIIFFSFHGLFFGYGFTSIKNFIIGISLFICLFGLIEYFLPDYFWDEWLSLPKYWNNDTQGLEIESIKQTGRGYTSDLYFLYKKKFRRMLSVFLEPSTLGSFFSYIFAFFYFSNKFNYKKIFLILILLCGMMVFSKIFILSILLIIAIDYFRMNLKLIFLGMTPLLIFLGYTVTNSTFIHGSFSHIVGVYTGFEIAMNKLFGMGLGMAGNRPMNPSTNIVNGENGAESGFGNVVAQIGVGGLIISIILYLLMVRSYKIYKLSGNSDYLGISAMILVYYLNYNLSASSLALSGNFIVFILAGVYLNRGVLMKKI